MDENFSKAFYNTIVEKQTIFNDRTIHYFTKPGIPHWDAVTPSQFLLSTQIHNLSGKNVFLFGSGNGAWVANLYHQSNPSIIRIFDPNITALELTQINLFENKVAKFNIEDTLIISRSTNDPIDTIIMDLPKGRELSRHWLSHAFSWLKPTGELFLAGSNDSGIQSVCKDALDVFGNQTILSYKKGNRLIRFSKSNPPINQPDWIIQNGIAPGTWKTFEFQFKSQNFRFNTLPGVFSSDHLDEGTQFLISYLPENFLGRALDFGCGCGVIGLLLANSSNCQVNLIDINLNAIQSARKNASVLNIHNVTIEPMDGMRKLSPIKFDLIISNPPFHNGESIDFSITTAFLHECYQNLSNNGRLMFVSNLFIPYQRMLKGFFHQVNLLASNRKFAIWEAARRD